MINCNFKWQSQTCEYQKGIQAQNYRFFQFCDSLFGNEANPRFVTEEKAYGFISYQAHRAKVSTENRKSTTDLAVKKFDKVDYERVLVKIGSFDHDEHDWSHFGDVLDFDMVN